MAFKLPDNIPKISQFTKMLTEIELPFEKAVKQTGFTLPPGPAVQLLNAQKSLEAGETPKPPSMESLNMPRQLQFPTLPSLPVPGGQSTSTSTTDTPATRSAGANKPYIAGGNSGELKKPAIF